MQTTPQLLTLEQVATILGIGERTIRNWRSMGQGPPMILLAGQLRVRPRDLAEWIDQCPPAPPVAPAATTTTTEESS